MTALNNKHKKEQLAKERTEATSEPLTFSVHSPSDFLPFYALFWL